MMFVVVSRYVNFYDLFDDSSEIRKTQYGVIFLRCRHCTLKNISPKTIQVILN